MASEDDPLGYYRVLGLAPNATQEQISHAYREWTKIYYQDSSSKNNTNGFHTVKKAYDTLSDEKLRGRYHSKSRAEPFSTQFSHADRTESHSQPFAIYCSICGKISAQPRYCVFARVFSFGIICRVIRSGGVFCPHCAAKKSLRESAISWICGWWSVQGIFHTIAALSRNIGMGEKPDDENVRLLIAQAHYFRGGVNHALAILCVQQAKTFTYMKDAETLISLEMFLGSRNSRKIKDRWSIYKHKAVLGHVFPILLLFGGVAFFTLFGGAALYKTVSIDEQHAENIPEEIFVKNIPAEILVKDIRHTASVSTTVWMLDGSRKYINNGQLPQFTTVQIVGPSSDLKFLTALLPSGQSGIIAMSDLETGDGGLAKLRWCQTESLSYPVNGDFFIRKNPGPHSVIIINSGTSEAVVKFRNRIGFVIVSIFVSGNSKTLISQFPEGVFQLEFATGSNWSRRCGIFNKDMHAQKFPTMDTFLTSNSTEVVQGKSRLVTHFIEAAYTITPVVNGNVKTELMDQAAFVRD